MLLAGASLTLGQGGVETAKIKACVDRDSGTLLLPKSGRCGKGTKRLSFNRPGGAGATGSAGETGPRGPAGPDGASGADGSPGQFRFDQLDGTACGSGQVDITFDNQGVATFTC